MTIETAIDNLVKRYNLDNQTNFERVDYDLIKNSSHNDADENSLCYGNEEIGVSFIQESAFLHAILA